MIWQTNRTNIKPETYRDIQNYLQMSVNTWRKKTEDNNNTKLSLPVHIKM